MQLMMAVVADAANVTTDGKLNVLGCFSEIHVPGVPATAYRMCVVVMLRLDLGEKDDAHHAEIRLVDPDGGTVMASPPLAFMRAAGSTQPEPNSAVVLTLQGVVLPKFGDYAFEVSVDGRHMTAIPLTVSELRLPPPGQG